MISSFTDLGVPADLAAVLARKGIEAPFPIQSATVPDAIAGRDVTGRAPTGSGKTIAFGLAIERVIDLALKAVPEVEPGILFVERQFGVLELHAPDAESVERAGAAILAGINAEASHQLKPRILYSDIIENITDQHAVIANRNRQASMVLPGETLLVYEMTPALFAAMAANEAERVAPDVTLVDVAMIGATGRIYMSGSTESVIKARDEITRVLEAVVGRDHK